LLMLRDTFCAVCFAFQAGRMHLCAAFRIVLALLHALEPSPFAALFERLRSIKLLFSPWHGFPPNP